MNIFGCRHSWIRIGREPLDTYMKEGLPKDRPEVTWDLAEEFSDYVVRCTKCLTTKRIPYHLL